MYGSCSRMRDTGQPISETESSSTLHATSCMKMSMEPERTLKNRARLSTLLDGRKGLCLDGLFPTLSFSFGIGYKSRHELMFGPASFLRVYVLG